MTAQKQSLFEFLYLIQFQLSAGISLHEALLTLPESPEQNIVATAIAQRSLGLGWRDAFLASNHEQVLPVIALETIIMGLEQKFSHSVLIVQFSNLLKHASKEGDFKKIRSPLNVSNLLPRVKEAFPLEKLLGCLRYCEGGLTFIVKNKRGEKQLRALSKTLQLTNVQYRSKPVDLKGQIIIQTEEASPNNVRITQISEVLDLFEGRPILLDILRFRAEGYTKAGNMIGSQIYLGLLGPWMEKLNSSGRAFTAALSRPGIYDEFSISAYLNS
jgi:hypothetical protein